MCIFKLQFSFFFFILSFSILAQNSGTFIDDRDKHEYAWVKIGEQFWMAQNLAYLPAVSPPSKGSITAKHYYVVGYKGNNVITAKASANYNIYGVLYNWYAAMDTAVINSIASGIVRGACPCGWHLPSDEEWEQMAIYIKDNYWEQLVSNYFSHLSEEQKKHIEHKDSMYRYFDELGNITYEIIIGEFNKFNNPYDPGGLYDDWEGIGEHLKATSGWKNINGTDFYGFSGIPSGYRNINGKFHRVKNSASWWSTTGYNSNVWYRYLRLANDYFCRYPYSKDLGLSIRCIKD